MRKWSEQNMIFFIPNKKTTHKKFFLNVLQEKNNDHLSWHVKIFRKKMQIN